MKKLTDNSDVEKIAIEGEKRLSGLSHIISFRLSESIYQELAHVSEITREGTPAELAREMVCAALSENRDASRLGASLLLARLARDIIDLQNTVNRLLTLLQA